MEQLTLVELKESAVQASVALDQALKAKSLDGIDYFGLADASHATKKRLASAIAAMPDDDTSLSGATSDGRMMLFNKSAQRPGFWQMTRFDSKGEPWGDTQYDKKLHGILEFLSDIKLVSLDDHERRFSKHLIDSNAQVKRLSKIHP